MLNASVGVQRVLGRLRRPTDDRATSGARREDRGYAAAHRVRNGVRWIVAASRLGPIRDHSSRPSDVEAPVANSRKRGRSLISRVGHDRVVAIVVAGILVGASVVSISTGRPAPAIGGTTGDGPAPRIAVGGGTGDTVDSYTIGRIGDEPGSSDQTGNVELGAPDAATRDSSLARLDFADLAIAGTEPVDVEGPFIDDGTLVKPIAVDTVVPDGAALVKTYRAKAGDTLASIARRFGVSIMTVLWANDLRSRDDVHKGQVLRIPPVTGLIVEVTATDTLDAIAARYDVDSTDILTTNGIEDPNLVVGQVLVVPGAKGKAIPAPQPTTKPATKSSIRASNGNGPSVRPPATYSGGKFMWPVVGGGNYISRGFRAGHYALDIAADYGSTVRAAADGIVTFAGWKSNGGGYQVWIAHGSGLFTTYNHMSAISVGKGQHVDRGHQVGRVGQSGNASGPHLHFEVWRGPIWDGGQRVNPLGYL